MKYYELDYECGIKEFDSFDIIQVAAEGQRVVTEGRKDEALNVVRGGSTGAIINGATHGICHRKAYARYHGMNGPLPQEIELMTKQGEGNEDIWIKELKDGFNALHGDKWIAKDQTEFECTWTVPETSIRGSGSPDIVIWEGDKPIRGLELKNISSVSKVKSQHYELRPVEDHLIQAANYAIRMGDQYNGGLPIPYQLVYSSRSVWHFFAMSEKVKAPILKSNLDLQSYYNKPPSTIQPFHRVYNIWWTDDGRMKYWTPGMKSWTITDVTRESIDKYYQVVGELIDKNKTLGPRPTTKHIDGKHAYSPCGFCEFKDVCDLSTDMAPQEFLDRCKVIVDDLYKQRNIGE